MIKALQQITFCLLLFLCFLGCDKQKMLETVTVAEFATFIEATGYQTDAEKFGWSVIQKTVYEYEIAEGTTWRKPDGTTEAKANDPVTQVSYNDAMAYCEWAGASLPDYEQYWKASESDKRGIIMNNTRILPVAEVNIVHYHEQYPHFASG